MHPISAHRQGCFIKRHSVDFRSRADPRHKMPQPRNCVKTTGFTG